MQGALGSRFHRQGKIQKRWWIPSIYYSDFSCFFTSLVLVEGSLVCREEKAQVGRVSEEKSRSQKIRDGESQKREDAGARKGRKVAIHCVFPMIWGSGGSKSNLAKAAGAEP